MLFYHLESFAFAFSLLSPPLHITGMSFRSYNYHVLLAGLLMRGQLIRGLSLNPLLLCHIACLRGSCQGRQVLLLGLIAQRSDPGTSPPRVRIRGKCFWCGGYPPPRAMRRASKRLAVEIKSDWQLTE